MRYHGSVGMSRGNLVVLRGKEGGREVRGAGAPYEHFNEVSTKGRVGYAPMSQAAMLTNRKEGLCSGSVQVTSPTGKER